MASIPEMVTLGLQEHQAGRLEQAEQLYREILKSNPYHADALHLLGVLISQKGRDDLAVPYIEKALSVKPHVAAFHNNLGFSYLALKRLDDAEWEFKEAIRLQPDFAMAHNNMGNVFRALGKGVEAAACYQRAREMQPDYHEAHGNLGVVLQEQGLAEEAFECYEQAIRLNPKHAETHVNRAMLWLLLGDWVNGWTEFEWRWGTKDMPGYPTQKPRWDGSDLNGRTILIYAEQGLGDTIQFVRYLPLVKQRGSKVILECQAPLVHLLKSAAGFDELVGRGSPVPAYEFHSPLMSLAGIFKTTVDNVPAAVPYLYADPNLVEKWRQELRGPRDADRQSEFLVGISWQGNPGKPFDFHRSVPLPQFAPLARIPGVRLISLQKGPGEEQLKRREHSAKETVQGPFPLTLYPLDESAGAFMDTAAVMMNLDLIISSDTAVPHLAGALGLPVWVALPLASDWRWLVGRSDSPWYPTMRLFRQTQYGNWKDVFERIAHELSQIVSQTHRPGP